MSVKIKGKVRGIKYIPIKNSPTDANLTISGASYSGTSFDVSGEDAVPTGIFFTSSGTKMFMIGRSSDAIHQYSLGTGFDLSTATYDSISYNVATEDSAPEGVFFNPSGTKMFVAGRSSDAIHQYSLGTGFDLSTVSYDSVSLDVTSEDNGPTSIFFNSSGTKMFMLGNQNDLVHQYTLGTGFDLTTVTYDSVSFSVNSEDIFPTGIYFNSTGTRMFMIGRISASVHQYTLSSGFDLSTAAYDSVSFSVSNEGSFPTGLFFSSDATKMFMTGIGSDSVHEYDL